MNNNTTAPTYTLRGLQLIGWRDMQHALDYLFADGQLKQGTLVAINAEKMPVSYTHLDVYKRQAHGRGDGFWLSGDGPGTLWRGGV